MFNDNDRRAIVQKRLKDAEQNPHVQRVQPDGGFVEDENRIGLRFADLACQLEPLRFAAGQARCFLAEREIAKAKLPENVQPLADGFHVLTEIDGRIHIHIHQLRQRRGYACLVCEPYIIGGPCIARATAVRAGNVNVRQELHVEAYYARSVAAGAAE